MAKFLTLLFSVALLLKPSLSRRLWESSVSEISAPSDDDSPIHLQEAHSQLQITALKGILRPIVFTNLHNVTELRIIRNQIRQIEPGALCSSRSHKILELDLSANTNPPTLTKSMFDNCNIEELFLKFDYNNPSQIDKNALEGLKNLKVLGIDSLNVTHLEKDFLILDKNLSVLLLSNIHVQTIDANAFDDLTNLEEVEIVHNVELEYVPEGLFKKCAKLKSLSLKDNAIKNLSWDEFEGLSSLEELNVADNKIEKFDAHKIAKYVPKLNALLMEMNPIGCEKEEEFVTALSRFKKFIKISTNRNNLLCM